MFIYLQVLPSRQNNNSANMTEISAYNNNFEVLDRKLDRQTCTTKSKNIRRILNPLQIEENGSCY